MEESGFFGEQMAFSAGKVHEKMFKCRCVAGACCVCFCFSYFSFLATGVYYDKVLCQRPSHVWRTNLHCCLFFSGTLSPRSSDLYACSTASPSHPHPHFFCCYGFAPCCSFAKGTDPESFSPLSMSFGSALPLRRRKTAC